MADVAKLRTQVKDWWREADAEHKPPYEVAQKKFPKARACDLRNWCKGIKVGKRHQRAAAPSSSLSMREALHKCEPLTGAPA